MTIRFLKNRSFEVPRPRLGYWIDIIPLRHTDTENISFAIAAQDLNGELTSRQSFFLSKCFSSRNEAELSWQRGFRVANSDDSRTKQLIRELLDRELAFDLPVDRRSSAP